MELIAFRVGTAWLAKHGIHDMPGHIDTSHVDGSQGAPQAHGVGAQNVESAQLNAVGAMEKKEDSLDVESGFGDSSESLPASAQILGVAILEFGVVFHSVSKVPPAWTDLSDYHRSHPRPGRSERVHHSVHRHHFPSDVRRSGVGYTSRLPQAASTVELGTLRRSNPLLVCHAPWHGYWSRYEGVDGTFFCLGKS